MFAFDRKPRPSTANSPAPKPASQRPAQALPVNPRWFRLATSTNSDTAASPEMNEERRRDFEPSVPALSRVPWSRVGHMVSKADMEAGASPPVAPGPQFNFARIPIMSPPVQRKATVSSPGDPYEREADEVADKVMRMAEPAPISSAPSALQRKCMECEDEEKNQIQTKRAAMANTEAALDTGAAIRVTERGGEPLPGSLRSYFEPRFGHDFSRVRVHAGDEATRGARAVQARAYTLGHNIVFGQGEYAPDTAQGKRLLAHELAHVVQQEAIRAEARPTIAREQAPKPDVTQGPAPAATATATPAAAPAAAPCITLNRDDLLQFFGNLYKDAMEKELKEADKYGGEELDWTKWAIVLGYEEKSRQEYEGWATELNQAFAKYGICGAYEISLFLGNVFNETRGFQVLTEMKSQFASSVSQWKGRGILQLTTKANYQAYADYSGNQGVMTDPESVSTDKHLSVDSAAWFWTERTKIHSNKFKNGGNPKNRDDDIDRIRGIMNPGERDDAGLVRKEFAGVRPGITQKSQQIYDYLTKKAAAAAVAPKPNDPKADGS